MMRVGVIGLDVGERRIRAVQLDADGSLVRRMACIVRATAGGAELADDEAGQLADALDRLGFTGSAVVMVPPRQVLCSSVLDLPPRTSGAPVEKIAMGELAGRHRIDPDRAELAHWSTGEPGSRNGTERIIAVACAHDAAEECIAPLERAGLQVVGIIPPAIALKNGMSSERSHHVALDLGWSSARIILVRDGVVIFDRAMQDGGLGRVFERAGVALGVRSEAVEAAGLREDSPIAGIVAGEFDGLCRDIRRGIDEALGYGSKSVRIEAPIELCGGGAEISRFVARLGSAIGREVKPAEPAIRDARLSPSYTSALGAARSKP